MVTCVIVPPLSVLSNRKIGLHAHQQAIVIIYQDSHTPLMNSDYPLSAVGHVWNGLTFSTVHLQLTTPNFIMWYSVWREGCIVSVAQPSLELVILGMS